MKLRIVGFKSGYGCQIKKWYGWRYVVKKNGVFSLNRTRPYGDDVYATKEHADAVLIQYASDKRMFSEIKYPAREIN